jgi:acyl-CoA synthetase (NDP forming)
MRTGVSPKLERVHDILRERRPALETMLAPRSVAVIGATEAEGSVGRTLLENLKANNFAGRIFPVNPKRAKVLGIPAFPRISALPQAIDLAVIVTPAATVPGIVGECVEAGVKGAVIISAGFKECGPEGAKLERRILGEARRGRMRIIGPNCLGVMRPQIGLNATFAADMALPGSVGFISQSGALCTAILDWSLRENVGFSAFVSVGSMLDVNWGDLIFYLGDDPGTKSIVIYMESIGDARSFLSAPTEPTATAEQLKRFVTFNGKPILASWMGGHQVRVGEEILNNAGIPTFPYPDTAARAFGYMWRYAENLRSLYETPAIGAASDDQVAKRSQAGKIIRTARKAKRTLLTEVESKEILAAYGIPVVETRVAVSEEEAVEIAKNIGGSVVLKIYSATITHKTDVGGVKLNLRGAAAVRRAYRQIQLAVSKHNPGEDFLGVALEPMIAVDGCELILGSSLDPQFGPVLLFGAGGQLVEVFKDRALALPPLNATLARRVIEQTRIFRA